MKNLLAHMFLIFTGAAFLGGCHGFVAPHSELNAAAREAAGTIKAKQITSEPRQLAAQGVKALGESDLTTASKKFNEALKLDPVSSWLQFLNGLIYHLQALQGDGSKFELAEQGYRLAMKFDRSNWIARYQLGLLYLDQKNYRFAQEQFADALLFNTDDPDLLYHMVLASYNARDPETAAGVLQKLKSIEPDSPRLLKATAVVQAALNRPEMAAEALELFSSRGNEEEIRHIGQRVDTWRKYFESMTPNAVQNFPRQLDPAPAEQGLETVRSNGVALESLPPDPENQMVVVDVVIIRTEEDISSRRGVNLLRGLQLTSDALSLGSLRDNDTRGGHFSYAVVAGLSIPSVTYSLNIFNSNTERNEILARPTLIALNGEESEFFSGRRIMAATVAGGYGGVSELQDDVGVSLKIVPVFLDDGRVKMRIEAERTFLQRPSSDILFENKFEKSQTVVTANVVMNFGETLILSGLSEKEAENIRDGVPLLQDIPIVQYFFSEKNRRDFQRSVLVLVTPRAPEYVFSESRGNAEQDTGKALSELKARYSDWFKPYPNWASVFHHMQSNSLYREFRTGDVTLERWVDQQSLKERLRQAMSFLYY